MNLATILVLLAVGAAAVLAVRVYRRHGKADCCNGGCPHCNGNCGKK